MHRFLRRTLRIVIAPLAGVVALLTGCQGKLLYFPRPYAPGQVAGWVAEPGTTVIDFTTRQGAQRAYLLSPSPDPERLWVVCGGNATLALEWSDWLREHGSRRDAWLMVEIPGYGGCEGSPRPSTIRESLRGAVPTALGRLGWSLPADREKLRFFGHSLGGAVCLMAAEEFDIRRGVLVSPFTSTMDMTRELFGVNLGFLVWHRFDNHARLKQFAGRGGAAVFIVHGTDDEVIPASMSRALAAEFPGVVTHTEVPGARHNDMPDAALNQLRDGLAAARRQP